MNCPKCGASLNQGDGFCQQCGAPAQSVQAPIQPQADPVPMSSPVASTKRCPYCGEEIQQVAIKCRYCNSDLTNQTGNLQARSGSNIVLSAPPAQSSAAQTMPSIVIQNVQSQQSPHPATFVPGNYKSPGTALLLSIIFPGGGQFYNGQAGKGILVLFTFWIGGITYIWSLFDAYSTAQRINRVGF
jgi:hypothetical protein